MSSIGVYCTMAMTRGELHVTWKNFVNGEIDGNVCERGPVNNGDLTGSREPTFGPSRVCEPNSFSNKVLEATSIEGANRESTLSTNEELEPPTREDNISEPSSNLLASSELISGSRIPNEPMSFTDEASMSYHRLCNRMNFTNWQNIGWNSRRRRNLNFRFCSICVIGRRIS